MENEKIVARDGTELTCEVVYWHEKKAYQCPQPKHGKCAKGPWLGEDKVLACWAGCPNHPKDTTRKSPVAGPKGEEIEVVESGIGMAGRGKFGAPTLGKPKRGKE